jgi:hypothetical protein
LRHHRARRCRECRSEDWTIAKEYVRSLLQRPGMDTIHAIVASALLPIGVRRVRFVHSSRSSNIYPPQSPTRMTNNSILKLPGAFHCVKTSRIRFCAFSYSIGDPCGRSDQLSMYFIVTPLFALKSSERICSDQRPSLARAGFVDKSAFGRKQRRRSAPAAAAFGSKADIPS